MNFSRITLLLLLILSFFFGCTALKDFASIQKPKISVADFQVSDVSLRDIELTFDIQIDNPNAISLNLDSYNFDFLVNKNSFVKGNQPLVTEIKPNASSVLQIPVSFSYEDLFGSFTSLRQNDEVEYDFTSIIAVDIPVLGLTEIPIEKSGVFPVVKLPRISASNLNVKNISFSKAELELELNIDNPNSFSLDLSDLNYNIDINGLKSVSGAISKKIDLSAKENNSFQLPITFNLIELGRGAYQILRSKEPVEYSITGSSNIDTSLPYFNASDFDFERSGSLKIFN